MVKSYKNQHALTDLCVLVLAPIVATIVSWNLPLNLLESTLLFFGPQALYISWRRKDIILRSLIFAITITIISILSDYLAERDKSWVSSSMFHIRLAGSVPIEALVWVFLLTYLIIAYYQFFYTDISNALIGRRMPYIFFASFAVIVWLGLTAVADIHFSIDYFYIKFGLVICFFPLLVFVFSFPQYLRIFVKTAPYFIALGLLNIIVSLHKGYWSYPGHHFIGWVKLGTYRFPLEELVFWIILYSSFVIYQFDFFDSERIKLKLRKTQVRQNNSIR